MKFGQLTEYNMGDLLLEKPYWKCGGETSSRPFYKKSKLSLSLDQLCLAKDIVCFCGITKLRSTKIYWT